ncbi:MAG: helix-turn-helix transcriptional regulator [Candidatus Omnitrophota bacterium]
MEKNIYRQLGRRIREIRKNLGVTQERLAFKARISPGFLSHVERGAKKASLETMQRIADALGVPVQNLFSPPKEPVAYLESDQDLFTRRLESLVRDKGDNFKKILWKMANYLAKEEGG